MKRAQRKKIIAMEKFSDPVRASKRSFAIRDRKQVGNRLRLLMHLKKVIKHLRINAKN